MNPVFNSIIFNSIFKFLIKRIIIISIIMSSHNSYSQQDYTFEQIGFESGLPDLFDAIDMVQDDLGFLWITSYNSLVKYDGYRMKVYHIIKDSSVNNSLFLDRDDNLWVGTNTGLSMYLREKDIFVNYDFYSEGFFIPDYRTRTIQEDKMGLLWVCSYYSGLYSFDKATKEVKMYKHEDGNPNSIVTDSLNNIVIDDSNNLWISTARNGLLKFDIDKKQFTNYMHDKNNINSIGSNVTGTMYREKSGTIWIGLDSSRFDEFIPETGQFIHYRLEPENGISAFYKDKYGMLWIASGMTGNGIALFDKNKSTYTLIGNDPQNHQKIQESYSVMIDEDRSGVIWIGTIMQGLEKFVRQKQTFKSYKNTLNPSKVMSITGDSSSNIWIGTMNGLEKLELSTGKYTHYENEYNNPNSLSNNQVMSLLINNSDTLWVGTLNGFNEFDTKNKKFTQYYHSDRDTNSIADNYIECLFEDSYGEFWIGTGYGGLDKFDRNKNVFIHHRNEPNDPGSIGSINIRAICEDRNRTMWFGSGIVYCGISRYDRSNETFTTFYNAQSIRGVTDIWNDSKNRFWVTSVWTGLNLFDRRTGIANTYNMNSALQSNCVYKILEDNSGRLWLSTHHGLSCFDPETEAFWNYDVEDGLSITEFSFRAAYKSRDETMYFGGEGGMISFNPDSVIINTNIPNIVLTDFKVFNQSILPSDNSPLKKNINVADKIELSYSDNSFSFEFAALDYNNPGRNQYAYMMEGFDKDWINSGNIRTANYTNLDPGDYIFRVKGSNNDGVWNEEGTSVRIIITPPWWQTWWFRGCGALLILGLLGYTRQRKLSKIREELQRQSEFTKQLINTQESERKRIAGELHDTLGQDLLIIKNKALLGLKDPLKNPEMIADISEISSSSLQEVREISYNLHPYQLEQLGLTKAIESIIERASKSASIKFRYELDNIDKLFNPETEINLFRMIQESINNILKHSEATEAVISVLKDSEEVSVNVKDNGKGFDVLMSKSKRGLGLMSLFERAKISGAGIEIDSRQGKGTLINISLSIPKN